ncbi:hypothetical protein OF83DRAFT_629363 [Amylostereum chailletii]|nr:hypothetical protein OF83DRAFT_629363 [Amylostereum chailletii]
MGKAGEPSVPTNQCVPLDFTHSRWFCSRRGRYISCYVVARAVDVRMELCGFGENLAFRSTATEREMGPTSTHSLAIPPYSNRPSFSTLATDRRASPPVSEEPLAPPGPWAEVAWEVSGGADKLRLAAYDRLRLSDAVWDGRGGGLYLDFPCGSGGWRTKREGSARRR